MLESCKLGGPVLDPCKLGNPVLDPCKDGAAKSFFWWRKGHIGSSPPAR